jgi:hypothetical protein
MNPEHPDHLDSSGNGVGHFVRRSYAPFLHSPCVPKKHVERGTIQTLVTRCFVPSFAGFSNVQAVPACTSGARDLRSFFYQTAILDTMTDERWDIACQVTKNFPAICSSSVDIRTFLVFPSEQ